MRYVDYLMPGIFVQTVAFGAINTGVGLAEDMGSGLIERFRSLPMARSAVLAGRTLADMARNLFVIILMVLIGFLVGFRVHTNVFGLAGAIGMMLLSASPCRGCWPHRHAHSQRREGPGRQLPDPGRLMFASSAFVPPTRCPVGCRPSPATSR